MKQIYDGLDYIRIPVDSPDILTTSLGNCFQNVQNIMENNVCISQTQAESYCSDYSHTRETEWLLNRGPGEDFTC